MDAAPADGGPPIPVFESAAVLTYLADKTGRFIPPDARGRIEILEWLSWHVANLGPIAGQLGHFKSHAREKIPYAIERYVKETNRLYGVLDRRLAGRDFVAGDYSIADMAAYPWVVPHEGQGQKLEDFPHVKRWFEAIKSRPATVRAYALAATFDTSSEMTEERRKILFGQTAASGAGK